MGDDNVVDLPVKQTPDNPPQMITVRYDELGTIIEEVNTGYGIFIMDFYAISETPMAETQADIKFMVPRHQVQSIRQESMPAQVN